MARDGTAGLRSARQESHAKVRKGGAGKGTARLVRNVTEATGQAAIGMARQARIGRARTGLESPGMAWIGTAGKDRMRLASSGRASQAWKVPARNRQRRRGRHRRVGLGTSRTGGRGAARTPVERRGFARKANASRARNRPWWNRAARNRDAQRRSQLRPLPPRPPARGRVTTDSLCMNIACDFARSTLQDTARRVTMWVLTRVFQ